MLISAAVLVPAKGQTDGSYVPTEENLQNRKQFEVDRFGIFIHWGIYASYAQGEWYLNNASLNKDEYAQAARCFYPIKFNASEWVKAIKDSGAKYICITSRHHDGFSMFKTQASPYNIVDGTPFGRDILKELADACQAEGISLHFYYSILDWIREDYPIGRTGKGTGRKGDQQDYNSYLNFMKGQVKELLENYGNIRALWFDGYWDHDKDQPAFDWKMPEFYRYIHSISPACLIGNNHHISPLAGEDFQMFERDLPGENKAGMSGQEISRLPLEMCQTMNDMWGYKVADLNYKSVKDLVQLLVRAAGKGSNLLLNIGPRPTGELPELSIDRLKGIGEWMKQYGETIYGTQAGEMPEQEWGISTRKGDRLFLHIFSYQGTTLNVPIDQKVKQAVLYATQEKLKFKKEKDGTITITLPQESSGIDYVIELTTK
ncbi:MAG: alpha-L-fucosidase [Bacteroidaceae bacterium]|nr:alpha-L-fucosidase [Bacteroidaceae bacterium]